MKTRYKKTGELQIFRTAWMLSNKRSFISQVPLSSYEGSDRFLNVFAHVLSKAQGKYPHFRLYLGNVCPITPEEHFILDHSTAEARISYSHEFKEADFGKWDTLEGELRELYSNVFPDKVGTMIMKYSKEEVREKIASLNIQYCYDLVRDGKISQATLSTVLPLLKKL